MADFTRIAMLGTGAMGSRVTRHLLDAQYRVRVYNRTREHAADLLAHGAEYAGTPREAVQDCDLAIAYVRDDEVSEYIWLDPTHGALEGLKAGAIAVESSTLTPAWVRRLAERMKARGTAFLDAPVAGSRPQAENKQLVSLVGGGAATFIAVKPIFDVFSKAVLHVGPVGCGATMKLGVNAFMATQVAALAELFANMAEHGVDPSTVLSIIGELPTTSVYSKAAGALMVARDDNPLFPISLVAKDLRYAVQLAAEAGLEMQVLRTVSALFADAEAAGLGAKNLTAIGGLIKKRTAAG